MTADVLIAEAANLPQFLTYRITRLHLALNAQATKILSEHDLGLGQWRMIAMAGSGAARTTRELAEETGMDPGFISRTLRSLEDAGLMRAKRSDADRRQMQIELTHAGRNLFEAVLPKMQRRQNALMDCLSPREREDILIIIDKLERAAKMRDFND